MLAFQKLTLWDIEKIWPYFLIRRNRNCDSTIGGSVMWRDYFKTNYIIEGGSLMFEVDSPVIGSKAYTFPNGGDTVGALRSLKRHCDQSNTPLVFCVVSPADVQLLKEHFLTAEATLERDWCDYLYRAEDLCFLTGKKYSGQRNHINKFKGLFPDYHFEVLDCLNIEKAKDFYNRLTVEFCDNSPTAREEAVKVREVLDHFDKYHMCGGMITIGTSVAAMALGETIGDTLYVHIEKADRQYQGSYQMIVNEFAKHFTLDRVEYINREEDVGDEGLRKSKLSYHPVEILEKYTVRIG